ncbi:hypothetical protein LOD99_9354 [Oopsacas minuta]|uniref:Uncharacterized protein n=1 Tax=Oopsacas minuta TaxID=111878 RepID=A0AAV7JBW5_9METZ|nr:hypothetical protein LOD99_9354 [Oopsacas minuta]
MYILGNVIVENLPIQRIGSKKLKHLEKREEARRLLKTKVLLDTQKIHHNIQTLQQRCSRERESDIDRLSQISEKRNNEESICRILAGEIELVGEGFDENSKELCITDLLR